MFLIILIFLAALGIEAIGAYISVLGLAAAFASDPIILTMAVILDFCKVIAVSTLSKRWEDLSKTIKTYMIASVLVLMVITSSGVAGYLSNSFQHAVLPNQTNTILLENVKQEQERLNTRKKEIDAQIAKLPSDAVRGRRSLIASFKPETDHINKRLIEIDAQIPTLQSVEVKQNSEVGPVMFIAKVFEITPEKAVSVIIAMIIFVFDPLAIVFLIAGNRLLNIRKKKKEEVVVEEDDGIDPEPLQRIIKDPEWTETKEPQGEAVTVTLNPEGRITSEPVPGFNPTKEAMQKLVDASNAGYRKWLKQRLHLPNAKFAGDIKPKRTVVSSPKRISLINKYPRPEQAPLIKEVEVIKEVPVEVIKEVIKEVPVEVIREVIREVQVRAPESDKPTLESVLKELLEHEDGKLTESERDRLNAALDNIFPINKEDTNIEIQDSISIEQVPATFSSIPASEEIYVPVTSQGVVQSSLNDPELDRIRGANAYFITGDAFSDPSIIDQYKS